MNAMAASDPIARICREADKWNMSRSSTLTLCVFAVIAYAALPWLLIGGDVAVYLAIWATLPLTVPVLMVAVSRRNRPRVMAIALLVCLWAVGVLLMIWGLVLKPEDYNHLVVIFLPIYMFAFIAAIGVAYTAFFIVRALVGAPAD